MLDKYAAAPEEWKFYETDSLENDSGGNATDNFCLHLPEDNLELNETYTVRAVAIRGGDCEQNTFYIDYKNLVYRRVIISQSLLPPERICFHWDFLNYIFYGKSKEELWREHELKYMS